ncbi:hypothetical protein EDB85DRAFT_1897593 [Lactarius pseudohatsudake]|nr:hypothetical protein EDB85DRAFT_1897593 [Lactarius pseudohatsudake]
MSFLAASQRSQCYRYERLVPKGSEIVADPPNENALPLDSFRNLQSLECLDIDPRTLLGWDRLSESLWSLIFKRSGLDDISNYGSARGQATPSLDPPSLSRQSSFHTARLPDSVAGHAEETVVTPMNEGPLRPSSPTESSVSPSYHHPKRVDVRHNQVEESREVGRLSLLPNIAEVWVEGNAFTEIESDYRVKCFDFFWKEGKSILLDGTPAEFYERRSLTSPPPEQMNSTRPMSKAYSPLVVPVGGAATATTAPPPPAALAPSTTAVAPAPSSGASSSSSATFSPTIATPPRHQHETAEEAGEAHPNANAAGTRITVSGEPSEHLGSPLGAPASLPPAPEGPLAPLLLAEDSMTPKAPDVVPPKHRRSHTEYAPALADSDGLPSPVLVRPPPDRTMSVRVSARRSAARRARAAASVFEAPGKVENGVGEEIKEADAFRARVEALRSEMGDGWLKVFSQSHAEGSG